MTRQQQIEIIRKACAAANPQVEILMGQEMSVYYIRPIRLADVLSAIGNVDARVKVDGDKLKVFADETMLTWNLRKDDLTEQSDECVEFLAEILK